MHTVKEKNRGYYKIKGAADAFNFDFKGKIVLDIGSSTGGFTQYALEQGASQVIAVEKGTNQMKTPLKNDPRVKLREKTDIFDVRHLETYPDVILADVSFISLRPILIHAKNHLSKNSTDFLVMLKPQFEARADHLNHGVIKNDRIRREIIKGFEFWLAQNGFLIIKKHDNILKGKNGNKERFYLLRCEKPTRPSHFNA